MKRTHLLLASLLVSAASAATVAGAQPSLPAAHTASRTTVVALRRTALGSILVNGSGRTLYEFTRDRGSRNSCVAIRGCAETWPALQTGGAPRAGAGVHASLLSTIKLRGGVKQVTYAGHPLYLYSGDSGPGETSYVGEHAFGGNWDALNSSGHAVK